VAANRISEKDSVVHWFQTKDGLIRFLCLLFECFVETFRGCGGSFETSCWVQELFLFR
jgi:hypothetical protein